MIKLLLVDDHESFREPLAFMLDREPDITVVGLVGSLAKARPLLVKANLALVDLDLPDGNGADLIRAFRVVRPRGIAVVLTASAGRRDLAPAVAAGAVALLNKAISLNELIATVRRAFSGEQLMTGRDVRDLLALADRQREADRAAQAALSGLTRRERDVLQLLAEGLNDKEMALRLRIGTETVRTHMVNLLAKLGVKSRLQALVFAVRHGAVDIADPA